MERPRTVSGMRPTGPLHLGHYFGVLKNYVALQYSEEAYFFVADWHALTSDYADPSNIRRNIAEMVKDWVAAGLEPSQCVIFRQSAVKEHAELSLLLSMITPVSWLERNPTYKEQQQQITNKDLGNAGFLCYPVLMAADILMYRPHGVPVGEDQLPHMELTREIARRFNYLYGENTFPEPQAMLTPAARCPGLDGRKMSKSYNNGIFLRDTMADIEPKVKTMFTDKNRLRKSDPGDPSVCNLFPYHVLLSSPEEQEEIRKGCVSASMGCVDCKKRFLAHLAAFLEPLQARRSELTDSRVAEILADGNDRARAFASRTLDMDSPTMYQAVVLGQADACVEDKPIMADSIKTGGLDLKVVEGMESEAAPYGMAIMNEANQELLDMFNAGLADIKADGTYDEIIATYLGE